MSTATFRFSTDILQRLGEELIATLDQGIVELVKNSYDADARTCTVELIDTSKPGGTIVVKDDGDGMTLDDIREGWLVLGRSRKSLGERTRLNRLPAGSKGLGRLGAIRMGDEVILETRPCSQPGVEYSLRLQWSDFARSAVVEDVGLSIQRLESKGASGTRVEVRGLNKATDAREVKRLARELLLLADPFIDGEGFHPTLLAPEFEECEQLVRTAYFDDCAFRLLATLDSNGCASATVFDRSGSARWTSGGNDFDESYRAPPSRFELWWFLLHSSSFEGRSVTVGEVRKWLEQVGGVHLYHRGIRVRPYGDSGHDWLNMNLARVRDPELRPSTNNSVGRVTVVDETARLIQRTDRTGFIENEDFQQLLKFATDALEWVHSERIRERRIQGEQERRREEDRAEQADIRLKQEIETLPHGAQQAISEAASEVEAARSSERDRVREELSLYKTLASVGTAVSVFAHEIEGPATDLTASVGAIERRSRKALGDAYEWTLGKQIEAARRSASLVARFATLPLHMLKRSKRRRTLLDVNEPISEIVELFRPYLRDARVTVECDLSTRPGTVHSSVADLEAIVSNLVSNAVKAFNREGHPPSSRQLVIRTEVADGRVLIYVLDNGQGIPPRLGEKIWLPGITSDENGTGLGLTIVRDTVADLGGRVNVIPQGERGGAEFVIDLPEAGGES